MKVQSQITIKYKIDYTKDQMRALEKSVDFTYGKDIYLVIEGGAGTGKTSILPEFIANRNKRGSVAITAPTHQAKTVLEEKLGMKGQTIQKLCRLRPNFNLENFDINNPPFNTDPNSEDLIKNYAIIIIDEASMINNGLLNFILDKCRLYNTKVLFVGDPYQLPPINENTAPVFKLKNKVIIRDIVRQELDNPLIKLLGLIRSDIEHRTDTFLKYLVKTPISKSDDGIKGYHTLFSKHTNTVNDFAHGMIKYFNSDAFKENTNFVKYTAYTNDNILDWNKYIRRNIITEDENLLIHPNDLLLSYNTIVDEFYDPIVTNGEEYIIYVKPDGKPDLHKYVMPPYNINGYLCRLQSTQSGIVTSKPIFIVDHLNVANEDRFIYALNDHKNMARESRNWKRDFYESFKDHHLLLKTIKEGNKTLVTKDIDYGFGLTVHKTQGSTFDNIFINLGDIIWTKYGNMYADTNLRNRLIYVALSRPRQKAIMLL